MGNSAEKQWIIKTPADTEKSSRLAAELGIDRVLADLLVQRGVETFEDARKFFRPSLEDLHNPKLKANNKTMVNRHMNMKKKQILKKKKI